MNIEKYIVEKHLSVFDTMKKINEAARGIVYVCDHTRLLGTVTDGDIRRYILRGGDLSSEISKVMKTTPVFVEEDDEAKAQLYMQKNNITSIPVLDDKHCIVNIYFAQKKKVKKEKGSLQIPLVIMAGGKGTRLKPYTDILPKPLIPVGDVTISERIMDCFAEYGCDDVYMIVNYKKNLIKAYFNDMETDRRVTFVDEHRYLGTGGGLKLLSGQIDSTFILSNCDILVDTDYTELIAKHKQDGNIVTMVCARKKIEVPYGVVKRDDGGRVLAMEEKPSLEYEVNTGLYIIEPEFLSMIPQDTFIHITDVIQECICQGRRVGSYLVEEDNWMDMGQMDEYNRMLEQFR